MRDKSMILYEYEDLLMGKRKSFDVAFMDSIEANRKAAGYIWRYAIENLLGWTPEQAMLYMNQELIKRLKLDKTYKKIGYEYSAKTYFDIRFILQYAFPESVHYSLEDDARSEYERVMKIGIWENDEETHKFHKNYFAGPDGAIRAAEVLKHAISFNLSHLGTFELYKFFGNKGQAAEWLKKQNIEVNTKSLYKTAIEYLHHSLPEDESNNVYFINEWLRAKYIK